MKVLLTGSSGLVGTSLLPLLAHNGYTVTRLVRTQASGLNLFWDPDAGMLEAGSLEGHDAVVHLAGESIATGRWTEAKKRRILDSRVKGTRLLSDAIAGLKNPPKVFVSASAIGFYGDRGDEVMKENSAAGNGFLPDVCKQWEAATASAAQKGVRVVNLRIGVVLTPKGGALAKMLLPFKLGLGGIIGSGKQFMSWITLDDVLGAIVCALKTDALRGPVNAVSPKPLSNAEYTRTLGRVLSRPTIIPMPAFAARLAFGQMADDLLLASTRVEPGELLKNGYRFLYPDLEAALQHLISKN